MAASTRFHVARTVSLLLLASTLSCVRPNPSQGYPVAMLASLVWIAGFAVISALVFRRQDVTALARAGMAVHR
jgi:hypothetical protein